MVIIRGNKTAMHEYQKELKKGTSNILDETIYSIVVFKRNVFFLLLKDELPNNSTSENLESLRFKILLSMSFHQNKKGSEGGSE